MSLEKDLKTHYQKLFEHNDWKLYKLGADKYFDTAATLKKRDIKSTPILIPELRGGKDIRLLLRNKRKRLFIGLGCELLIKAYYLKSGFYINTAINKHGKGANAFLFSELTKNDIDLEHTIKFHNMIQGLGELDRKLNNKRRGYVDPDIKNALCIAKVFRNKEAHLITRSHKYNKEEYEEIENGIMKMYELWFNESLDFQISFEPNEKGKFKIKNDSQ